MLRRITINDINQINYNRKGIEESFGKTIGVSTGYVITYDTLNTQENQLTFLLLASIND